MNTKREALERLCERLVQFYWLRKVPQLIKFLTFRSVHFHPALLTRPSFSIFGGSGSSLLCACEGRDRTSIHLTLPQFQLHSTLNPMKYSIYVQVRRNAGALFFSNLTLGVIEDCIPHCVANDLLAKWTLIGQP